MKEALALIERRSEQRSGKSVAVADLSAVHERLSVWGRWEEYAGCDKSSLVSTARIWTLFQAEKNRPSEILVSSRSEACKTGKKQKSVVARHELTLHSARK
jgi:hypothetical protein